MIYALQNTTLPKFVPILTEIDIIVTKSNQFNLFGFRYNTYLVDLS